MEFYYEFVYTAGDTTQRFSICSEKKLQKCDIPMLFDKLQIIRDFTVDEEIQLNKLVGEFDLTLVHADFVTKN